MDEAAIVRHLLDKLPGALAVYLFGSRAAGEAGAASDLDIAVLVEGRVDPLALWETANALSGIVGCHVDLVDLRTASTVMQHQIVVRGRRLWSLDARAGIYEAFILSEKLELDAARGALLADIAREGKVHGR